MHEKHNVEHQIISHGWIETCNEYFPMRNFQNHTDAQLVPCIPYLKCKLPVKFMENLDRMQQGKYMYENINTSLHHVKNIGSSFFHKAANHSHLIVIDCNNKVLPCRC